MAAGALLATRGRLPINLKYVFEGEEESSSVHLDAWLDAEPRPARGRRRDHQRHRLLRGQPAGDHARPARADVRPDRRGRDRGRPPLRELRRRRPEPGQRARPDHRRAQGPRRPDPHPGLLRRRRAADRRRPGGARGAAVRRGGVPRPARAPGARRRGRLHDARAARRAPDARRQRHLGRLPGRGQQDDHPGPRPRQGQLPARRRPGSRADLRGVPRRTSRRSRRPA